MQQLNKSLRRSSSSPKPTSSLNYTCPVCFNVYTPEVKSFQCQHQDGDLLRQCARRICHNCFEHIDSPTYICPEHKTTAITRPKTQTRKRKAQNIEQQEAEEQEAEEPEVEITGDTPAVKRANNKQNRADDRKAAESRVNKPCRGKSHFAAHPGKSNFLTSGKCANCSRAWCRECKKLFDCCPSCCASLLQTTLLADFPKHYETCDRLQLLLAIKQLQLANKQLEDKLNAHVTYEVSKANPPPTKAIVRKEKPKQKVVVVEDESEEEQEEKESKCEKRPRNLSLRLEGKIIREQEGEEEVIPRDIDGNPLTTLQEYKDLQKNEDEKLTWQDKYHKELIEEEEAETQAGGGEGLSQLNQDYKFEGEEDDDEEWIRQHEKEREERIHTPKLLEGEEEVFLEKFSPMPDEVIATEVQKEFFNLFPLPTILPIVFSPPRPTNSSSPIPTLHDLKLKHRNSKYFGGKGI